MEDLPSPGDTLTQTADALYVRKHDPFLMYLDGYNNPSRANKVVPLTQLNVPGGALSGRRHVPAMRATSCKSIRSHRS